MEKGLNFRTQKGQDDYFKAYEKSLKLWTVPYTEQYIETSFGISHVLLCGEPQNPPLVLIHAASCGATIWYENVNELSKHYRVYAIDLITESSKSILTKKISSSLECAKWLDEAFTLLHLEHLNLCGLSIGGWHAANYSIQYPEKVNKLILISPIQTLAKMYPSFFIKIMQMGFNPTRENVERYIGWGGAFEKPLPDSVIAQFAISAMNINSNNAFPKMIKKDTLKKIQADTLILLGEKEFSFDIRKAERTAEGFKSNVCVKIVENASHLISVSLPDVVNSEIITFLK